MFSEKEKVSVLALHGFTGSGTDFDLLRTFLPKNWHWETPDLPAVPFEELVQLLQKYWEKLAGTRRVFLGYSMGGRLALHLSQTKNFWKPNDKLVLISASPGIAFLQEREIRRLADNALAEKIEKSASSEAFYAEWQKNPLIASQHRLPSPWRERLLECRKQADRRVWAEHLRNFGTGTLPSLWNRLREIKTPETLIFAGDEDEKFCRIAERMNKLISRSRVFFVPASGHSPHLENTQIVATLIENATLDFCGNAEV